MTAASIHDNVTFTVGRGDDAETYTPELDSLADRRIFVVMHAETRYDAFR